MRLLAPPSADDATTQSDAGEVDRSEDHWTVVAEVVWAEIAPDSGGLVVVGEQDVEQQRYRITVRRGLAAILTPGCRLKALEGMHAGKFFSIESAGRGERDEEEVLIGKRGKLPA